MAETPLDAIFDEGAGDGDPSQGSAQSTEQGDIEATPADGGEGYSAQAESENDDAGVGESTDEDRSVVGLRRGITAERSKRQAAEREAQEAKAALLEMQQRIAAVEARTAQRATPDPTPDPDELMDQYLADPVGYTQRLVRQAQEQADNKLIVQRAEMSEVLVSQQHADYAEAKAAFAKAAQEMPGMWQQVFSSPMPASVVYERGKALLAHASGADAVKLQQQVEELQAQIEQLQGNSQQPTAQPPKSNAGARGTGVRQSAAWRGPTPLDDILGH